MNIKLIKNRRSWLRWKRTEIGSQDDIQEPKQYPCLAYTSVQSFGYEEYAANYIYWKDVEMLRMQLYYALHATKRGPQ